MSGPSSRYSKGVSLIEVILALSLFSIILVSVFDVQWQIGDLFVDNSKAISASNFAHFRLFGFLSSGVIPSDLSTSPFTRCENLIEPNVTASLISSDLSLARKYGKDCAGQPRHFSAENFVLTDMVELGFPATAVDISKNYAYVSLKPVSDSDPDIAAISLVNRSDISFLNIGTGLNKIDAIENAVFAAQNASSSQLVSVDSALSVFATSTLSGVTGLRPEAVSVSYFDSKVYLGTKRTAGREFHAYDVSDPVSPDWLGSLEVNHNINDISVKNGFAFLSTSGNIRDLIVLDVRNPVNITQPVVIDLPGTEDGKSIAVVGDLIFLGRYKGLAPGHDELCVLRYWFDPDGTLETTILGTAPTGADINAITYVGGFVFAATSNPVKELQVFEFTDDDQLVSVLDADLPAIATGIDAENNIFSVTAGTKLYIYEQE